MINIPSPAWALIGVLVGFVLNEVSRLFREICRIRKLKRVLEAELQTIKVQIKDKEDILLQAIQACTTRQVLPMISVCTVRTGYDAYLGDLYIVYSKQERYCLHVIYERLRISDEIMDSFHKDFQKDLTSGDVRQPWDIAVSQLQELLQSYDVIDRLLQSFLDGHPENIFAQVDSDSISV